VSDRVFKLGGDLKFTYQLDRLAWFPLTVVLKLSSARVDLLLLLNNQ